MSEWNLVVKKVYEENHAKDSSYQFKDALVDAKKVYRSSKKSVADLGKSVKKAVTGKRKSRRHRRTRRHK